jgi:hypothetical protein
MLKKIVFGTLSFIVIIFIVSIVFPYFSSTMHSELLADLEGTIYYSKRVDGVTTLFKSDATLKNETLIYCHKGKGKDGFGSYNDNIIDFYYDKSSQTMFFTAMNKGDWSLFSLKDGEKTPTFLRKEDMMAKTDYIQNQFNNRMVTSKEGSIYLSENGKEKTIKKFHGIHDEKFTGYGPIGFSPDGKYLVYHSMEHLTSFGTLLESLVNNSFGHTYIMELSTMESTRFIDASNIQWIIE